MPININHNSSKNDIFDAVHDYLISEGFQIINSDQSRPWGGFYVIDEEQSDKFIEFFLSNVKEAKKNAPGKISPKILKEFPKFLASSRRFLKNII